MIASEEKMAEVRTKCGRTIDEILAKAPEYDPYEILGAVEVLVSWKIYQNLPTTLGERMVFACKWMAIEVQNGGLDQYFFNSAGDFWTDVLGGLRSSVMSKVWHGFVMCFRFFQMRHHRSTGTHARSSFAHWKSRMRSDSRNISKRLVENSGANRFRSGSSCMTTSRPIGMSLTYGPHNSAQAHLHRVVAQRSRLAIRALAAGRHR